MLLFTLLPLGSSFPLPCYSGLCTSTSLAGAVLSSDRKAETCGPPGGTLEFPQPSCLKCELGRTAGRIRLLLYCLLE